MKTAIARRTFRRTDTNQIVHIGQKIEGDDAYIDELVRCRTVKHTEGTTHLTYENVPLPTVAAIEPEIVVTTSKKPKSRTRKKTKKYADWNHQSSE